MANRQSDSINITNGAQNGGMLNLSSINVRSDGKGGNDILTYLSGNLNGLDLTIRKDSTIEETRTVTNNYTYTFTSDGDGKLDVQRTLGGSTLKDFIEGNLPQKADTYSATEDIQLSENEVPLGTTEKNEDFKELNLNMNGNNLIGYTENGKKNEGMTIADGYTFNFDGRGTIGTPNSTMLDFATAITVTDKGTLNLSNMTFRDNVTDLNNNGRLNLSGENKINTIIGKGHTTVADGITVINNTLTQNKLAILSDAQLQNTGKITTETSNEGTLINSNGAVIAGKLVNSGEISNSGNIVASVQNDYIFKNENDGQTNGNIINNGNFSITDNGVLNQQISGTGTTSVYGDLSFGSGSFGQEHSLIITKNGSIDLGSKEITLNQAALNGTVKMTLTKITPESTAYQGGKLIVQNGAAIGSEAALSLTIAAGMLKTKEKTGELELIAGDVNGEFASMLSNNRCSVTSGRKKGTYIISNVASASDILDGIGGNQNNKNTGEAWDLVTVPEGSMAEDIRDTLNELSQHDSRAYVEALTNLAPTDSQLALMTTREINNIIGREVTHRFEEKTCNCGLPFKRSSVWMQGIGAYAKQNERSSAAGFSAHTAGYIIGVDGTLGCDTVGGFGYAYNRTKADSHGRDTDIDGNTLFIYGKYQPDLWYIRTMASYGMADYSEHANVAGIGIHAKYDVRTIGAEAAAGYELPGGLTPEVGLRYTYLMQDNYTDSVGQYVSNDDIDALELTALLKYRQNYETEEGLFQPEIYAGITYDAMNGDKKSNIYFADTAYQIIGKKLPRLGMEAGLNFSYFSRHWDLALDYSLNLRNNYYAHTGMLKLRYNF